MQAAVPLVATVRKEQLVSSNHAFLLAVICPMAQYLHIRTPWHQQTARWTSQQFNTFHWNNNIWTTLLQISLSGITRVSPQAVLLFGKDWTFDTNSSTGKFSLTLFDRKRQHFIMNYVGPIIWLSHAATLPGGQSLGVSSRLGVLLRQFREVRSSCHFFIVCF